MRWEAEEPEREERSPEIVRITSGIRALTRLYVTNSVAESWKLRDGALTHISMGVTAPARARVYVREGAEDLPAVVLVPGTNLRYTISPASTLHAFYEEDTATVRLGPTIGLLTFSTKVMFGPQGGTFRDLMRVGARGCALVYAFTPEDIDWPNRVVKGYYYLSGTPLEKGRWVKSRFPMPDVVYNRIPRRIDERRLHVTHTLQRLRTMPGLSLFNTRFLNKWEVQKRLVVVEELRPRIPATALWKGPQSLARILRQHSQAFLKPVSSSLGNGAMRIRCTPSACSWELNVPGKGTRRRITPSIDTVCSLAAKEIGKQPYLIQQCIDLVTYHGRPFDVRILVQKDDRGRWRTTGMAARVAQQNRITTHIPNGGKAYAIWDTLHEAFEGTDVESNDVEHKLSETAELAARAVDSVSGELYGELSLDVGVDTDGHIWIFEVNAKPFRFDEETIRQTALRKMIGYSTFLAGYGSARRHGSSSSRAHP